MTQQEPTRDDRNAFVKNIERDALQLRDDLSRLLGITEALVGESQAPRIDLEAALAFRRFKIGQGRVQGPAICIAFV